MNKTPGSNAHIDELVALAASVLTPEAFAAGLDDDQADALMTLHGSIAHRYGSKAASRACSRLGGVSGLQQLLKAMHKRKLAGSRQARLLSEIDEMLKNSDDVDKARGT